MEQKTIELPLVWFEKLLEIRNGIVLGTCSISYLGGYIDSIADYVLKSHPTTNE